VTDEIARSLMDPLFGISEGCNQSEQYAFVRLFANPTVEMNADVVSLLIQLLIDQYEFISVAAVQLMIVWVLTYEVAVPSSVVYRTVAVMIVDESDSMVLLGSLLNSLGTNG
jgi:hypothetical protein